MVACNGIFSPLSRGLIDLKLCSHVKYRWQYNNMTKLFNYPYEDIQGKEILQWIPCENWMLVMCTLHNNYNNLHNNWTIIVQKIISRPLKSKSLFVFLTNIFIFPVSLLQYIHIINQLLISRFVYQIIIQVCW